VSQFHLTDPANPSEVIAVTNISGLTWTVTRGSENTTPVTHLPNFVVYQVVTAGYYNSNGQLISAQDGQGNQGVNVLVNPTINSMASATQASAISSGGTTGSPQVIAGNVNYSLIDGGYDDVIETSSVGVLKIQGAHDRIFGSLATHSGINWGSYNEIYNASYSVIGGGTGHTVASDGSVIAGGEGNTVTGSSYLAAIGGGSSQIAYGNWPVVAGGTGSTAAASGATVGGGSAHKNFGASGTIAGGSSCQVGDGIVVTDGAMTSGSPNLACHTSTPFAAPVAVGSTVIVLTGGPAPAYNTTGNAPARAVPLVATIASITDTGDAVLSANAATTVSGGTVVIVTGDANGSYATIGGGYLNTIGVTAPASYATVVGGRSNDAEASYSAVLGGMNNSATMAYATAGGYQSQAYHYGGTAHSSGQFATQGDNQREVVHIWRQGVNSTSAYELRLDGQAQRLGLTNFNTAWRYTGEVLAKQTGGIITNAWHVEGVIAMAASVGTTVLKWSAVDVLYGDSTTATVTTTADTTNGALSVQFQDSGGGAVTWYVAADIQIRKITG